MYQNIGKTFKFFFWMGEGCIKGQKAPKPPKKAFFSQQKAFFPQKNEISGNFYDPIIIFMIFFKTRRFFKKIATKNVQIR